MKQQPHLYVGGLSGEVFCAIVYTETGHLNSAVVKFNVTEDFERVARELGWTPPVSGTRGQHRPTAGPARASSIDGSTP